jgi:inosine-uridine nucleoside N-ribohydrolase
LAYLLAHPECELLGITTVSGEPEKRAMMASSLCHVAGRRVPIYPGAANPLLVAQRQVQAQQAAALGGWRHDTDFPGGEAIEFLRRTIRAHPGEVTLLTIGPLTNAALLFAVDPEIPSLLKQLVMMVGVFTPGVVTYHGELEWNALLDPHATAMVYRTPVRVHRSIGLDVTTQVQMPAAEVRERFQTKLLRPVLDYAEVWFRQVDHITFHDPLAAVTIFEDHVCRFDRGNVQVELGDPQTQGKTIWTAGDSNAPHEVAFGVDAPRFFQHFFGVFESGSKD